MSCDITGFYPPKISVTWFKRGQSEDGELKEAAGKEEGVKGTSEVWGPIQTQPRMFRATAVLKEVEDGLKEVEEGGEIVCRVEHCSLQEPTERVWRKFHFGKSALTFLWPRIQLYVQSKALASK